MPIKSLLPLSKNSVWHWPGTTKTITKSVCNPLAKRLVFILMSATAHSSAITTKPSKNFSQMLSYFGFTGNTHFEENAFISKNYGGNGRFLTTKIFFSAKLHAYLLLTPLTTETSCVFILTIFKPENKVNIGTTHCHKNGCCQCDHQNMMPPLAAKSL